MSANQTVYTVAIDNAQMRDPTSSRRLEQLFWARGPIEQ
jgi:hypothetical protein